MCGKCGLNNCSCAGKSCDKPFTGSVIFDGAAFDCAVTDALDIAQGENMNEILAKMLPLLCLASEKPKFETSADTVAIAESTTENFGSLVADRDGTYIVRAVLYYQITGSGGATNITTDFFFRAGTNTTQARRLDHEDASGVIQTAGSFVLEEEMILSASDSVSVECIGIIPTSDGTLNINGYTLYIKRVS